MRANYPILLLGVAILGNISHGFNVPMPSRHSGRINTKESSMKTNKDRWSSGRIASLELRAHSAVPWVVGSILGGCTGTPLVIKATSSWYREIELPNFTPPDKIFAPVWTALYGTVGYVGWAIHNAVGWKRCVLIDEMR